MTFLGTPTEGFVNKLKNVLLALAVYALYIFIFSQFMEFLWTVQVFFQEPPEKYRLFMTLVFAPVLEEVVFRVGPLGYVKNEPEKLVPMIIMSSALFGWLHGGPMNWAIQGVMGVLLCAIYLKNGYSYWSAVLLHFLWNLACVAVLEKL